MSIVAKKNTTSKNWARSVGATARSKNDHLLTLVIGRIKDVENTEKPKRIDKASNAARSEK